MLFAGDGLETKLCLFLCISYLYVYTTTASVVMKAELEEEEERNQKQYIEAQKRMEQMQKIVKGKRKMVVRRIWWLQMSEIQDLQRAFLGVCFLLTSIVSRSAIVCFLKMFQEVGME